jgi:two-component system LytT family response regulator
MIKAIIIDDEPLARELIKAYLKNSPLVEVVAECGDGFEGLKSVRELKPDLVFLDVQMPKLTGFEFLEVLDDPLNIIFTTAYDEFAIKAFENNAVDYLLKPFSKERLEEAVEKAAHRLKKGDRDDVLMRRLADEKTSEESLQRIIVKTGSKVKVISTREILYLEAQDDFVAIHTREGKFLKQQTMKYFEDHLEKEKYLRIHRSFIVNLDEVEHLEPYEKDSYRVILKNKTTVPVSRSGYARLRERFGS